MSRPILALNLVPLLMLLCVTGVARSAAAENGEIICETIHEPVPVHEGVYVLEHYTRCYHPAPTPADALDNACALLQEAYGEASGSARCEELGAKLGFMRGLGLDWSD